MNAERLLAHYHRIAEAPDAMARLRLFILDLAVRGKLVPQNSNDERAATLLERIRAEKSNAATPAAGKSGGEAAPLSSPGPYEIPCSWIWVPVGAVVESHVGGGTPPKVNGKYWGGSIPWASVKDIGKAKYVASTVDSITPEGLAASSSNLVAPNSLIVVTRMGLGKLSINTIPMAINQDLRALALSGLVSIDFVYNFFRTHQYEGSGLTVKGIRVEELLNTPLPLPPLAEQQRIVTKVDELMALCDELEAARTSREATRDRLTAASLARLNDPDPDPTTFAQHARFALDALPSLTARADQIKQIRQTILNLAVRGKLVPQEPNDEPATVLLERIRRAKAKARHDTRDSRIQDAPEPTADRLPMELPFGWAAQSFENLFLFIDYRGNTPPKTESGVPLITAKNVRMGRLNPEPREFISDNTYRTWMTRGFPSPGDLFFTTEAPLANVCVNNIRGPFALAQRVICLHPYGEIESRYLMFVLMSGVMQSLIESQSTGLTAKGVKAAKLKPLPIPIAPLAEQRRIAAKVDELITLCDRLETHLAAEAETRARLLDALLAEAIAPRMDAMEAIEAIA